MSKAEEIANFLKDETKDNVAAVLSSYHQQAKLKKVLEASIQLAIERARTELEKCSSDDLPKAQGVIRGLRHAIGCLQAGSDGK